MLYLPSLSLRGSWSRGEDWRGGGWVGDVITTVAELSPHSVVSLLSVQHKAFKIIPPIVLTNTKWRAENCNWHPLLCQR